MSGFAVGAQINRDSERRVAANLTWRGKVAVFCAFIGAQISAIRRILPVTVSPYFPPREPLKGTAARPRFGRQDNKGYK